MRRPGISLGSPAPSFATASSTARVSSRQRASRRCCSGGTHDAEQALGWQLRTIGGRHVVGHEGEDAGATTGLYVDLVAGSGAIVLANGDAFGSGDRARAEAIQTIISELARAIAIV